MIKSLPKKMYRILYLISFLLFTYNSMVFSQQLKSITGIVIDGDSNESLPGTSITVRGTNRGVVTKADGKYEIQAKAGDVLIFNFLGFIEQSITVGDKTNIDVKLESSASSLNEVVVIGYGSIAKSDLSGAVSSINAKDIGDQSFSNFQQFLSGRASGVVVQEASGAPGAGLSIEIRGMSSISGNSQPLYVIDGLPFDAIESSGGSIYAPNTVTNPLADINPNDIESVEILKDASATAIYGSRGANGVVLVTTKKGKIGAPRINLSYNYSLSEMNFPVDRLNLADQITAVNERLAYRGFDPGYTPEEIPNVKYYDHLRDVSRTGSIKDANLSISGGTAMAKYYISYQNFDQQGIYKNSGLNRNSVKVNLESNIWKNLKLTSTATYNRTVNTGYPVTSSLGSGLFTSALAYSPLVPMINPDGSYNKLGDYRYGDSVYEDPLLGTIYYNPRYDIETQILGAISEEPSNNTMVLINDYKSLNTAQTLVGNFGLSYKISNKFTLNGKLGVIARQALAQTYRPRSLPVERAWKGMARLDNGQSKKLLYESTLNYNTKIGKHKIDGVVGATLEKYEGESFFSETREFPNDLTGFYDIGAGSSPQVPRSDYDGNQLASYLGRFNYNFDNRYLVTLTGRYDGSSRFAKGNQFGFFPSAAVSWRVLNEKFMKSVKFLSDLKLRASYGVVGNQAVGNYSTLSTYGAGSNYNFGSVINTAYTSSRLPNPDLSWEESKSLNLGADVAVLKNRITLGINLYQKDTEKLLYTVITPLTTGFSNTVQNVGAMQNKGLELDISVIPFKGNFFWKSDFNIGFNRNKIVKFAGDLDYIQSGTEIGGFTRSYLGRPIAEIYGYRTLPVWNPESLAAKPATFQPGAREGDARYEDVNGNNVLDNEDLVPLGNSLPKFTGGFGNNISYKSFDFNIFMSFSYGAYAYNAFVARMADVGGNNTANKFFENRYRTITPDMDLETVEKLRAFNQNTHYPRAGAYTEIRTSRDYYVEDASYIRVNSMTFGYTLDSKLVNRIKIQSARLFITAQNPFIITNYSGINPEGASSNTTIARGIDNGSYPLSKIFLFGANLRF
ncbi:SusC/RagA family TonB-linked outer membrane protein [Pedobacter glucosidilyticus]|uniref:SusC/RagA family TonB-linked outer membrane protein n=1 Tax=Pedobacter glucosidilyticus TaxID=1122941 RepID=UPI0026E988A2|nr:TonB-dependent receptor [Pedobacter glucosidilyticus]